MSLVCTIFLTDDFPYSSNLPSLKHNYDLVERRAVPQSLHPWRDGIPVNLLYCCIPDGVGNGSFPDICQLPIAKKSPTVPVSDENEHPILNSLRGSVAYSVA